MRPARNGFTLVEVVVALAIGGFSLAALLQIFGDGARRADRAVAERLAWLVAQSALDAAQAELTAGAQLGGVDHGLAWRVDISEYGGGGGTGAPQALLLVASVAAGGEGPVLARLATLRLARPAPALLEPTGTARRPARRPVDQE